MPEYSVRYANVFASPIPLPPDIPALPASHDPQYDSAFGTIWSNVAGTLTRDDVIATLEGSAPFTGDTIDAAKTRAMALVSKAICEGGASTLIIDTTAAQSYRPVGATGHEIVTRLGQLVNGARKELSFTLPDLPDLPPTTKFHYFAHVYVDVNDVPD